MRPQAHSIFLNRQKLTYSITACLLLLALANILLDFLVTRFQHSRFYFSESLLFSSFWILFLPLLHMQSILAKKQPYGLWSIGIMVVLHLVAYPALVLVLSKSFYYHTFSYGQTFDFGLTTYAIQLILIYSFSFIIFKNKFSNQPAVVNKLPKQLGITSLIVSDSNSKKTILQTNDIFYFSANPPYVTIHHSSKKYLHTETLKSLETQLDNQFLRIHKSHLVNLSKVVSFQSRGNGDYDVVLSDHTQLRVSRNYVKDFKSKIEAFPPLTAK